MAFLREQLSVLEGDLYPSAIKVGMLGTEELATEVGGWLEKIKGGSSATNMPLVVVDPVMISTSGHKLIDDKAKAAMIERVFPHADVVTPNKFEAEELLGRKLTTPEEVEQGAREILAMGPAAVLIKGGHSLLEEQGKGGSGVDDSISVGYAQDFLLMSTESSQEGKPVKDRPRLCDGSRGVWIRNDRYDTIHTHGTGCTLSSSIATAWAIGRREREGEGQKRGALSSIHLVDACCIAKAYVNAGIARGVQVSNIVPISMLVGPPQPGSSVQIGQGPGPVVHTGFPSSSENFPTIVLSNSETAPAFLPMKARSSDEKASSAVELGSILPIVDTVEWVEKLATTSGVEDIQLRFKDTSDYSVILERIKKAQAVCKENSVRLWINDYWRAAIEAGGCFGIHLGQEDMASCADDGGLGKIRSAGLAFGISTHSYSELAAALGVRPSYISLGPVFATSSKDVKFDPQGLETVRQWRSLIPTDIPLVAIGGISDAEIAKSIRDAGADCSAVIGAVTKAEDVTASVHSLNTAMR